MDISPKKFAAALIAAREEAGLTQEELARQIQRTQQAVAKWENGENMPTRRSVSALVSVLPSLEKLELPKMEVAPLVHAPENTERWQRTHFPGRPMDRGPLAPRRPHDSFSEREIFELLPAELKRHQTQSRVGAVDYESPSLVLEIVVVSDIDMLQPFAMAIRLWRLSVLRLKNNDERSYCLLVVGQDETGSRERTPIATARMNRFAEEADLHGIQIYFAKGAAQAARIIEEIEADMRSAMDIREDLDMQDRLDTA